MINRFRELLPYDEVPIKLVLRGRVKGQAEEVAGGGEEERPTKRPTARPTRPKHPKRPAQSKPHPKKSHRGPARGTRPN
jgi:hypothetical protein